MIEMMSVTTVSTSSDMASSKYKTLNKDLTDRAVLSTARAYSRGPIGSRCWMPVTDSIGRPSANAMCGLL